MLPALLAAVAAVEDVCGSEPLNWLPGVGADELDRRRLHGAAALPPERPAVPVHSARDGSAVCWLPQRLVDWAEYDLSGWCGATVDAGDAYSRVGRGRSGMAFAVWHQGSMSKLGPGRPGNAEPFLSSLARAAAHLPNASSALFVIGALDLPRSPIPGAGRTCDDVVAAHGAELPTALDPSVPVFSPCTVPGCFRDIVYPSVGNVGGKGSPQPWDEKADAVFWRGSMHAVGLQTGDGSHSESRNHRLRLLSAVHSLDLRPTQVDVGFVPGRGYGDAAAIPPPLRREFVDPAEMGRNRYSLDVDGMGWSGRTAQLMGSNSTVVLGMLYHDVFHRLLEPWVHYVPFGMWAGASSPSPQEALAAVTANESLARRIADAGARVAAAHTEGQRDCYVLYLAQRYLQCVRWKRVRRLLEGSRPCTVTTAAAVRVRSPASPRRYSPEARARAEAREIAAVVSRRSGWLQLRFEDGWEQWWLAGDAEPICGEDDD